jgi:ribonuclease Z
MQLRKYRIGFGKINHIFISHLHGDHFYGLIGLISTFAMLGRHKELHIYAPAGLEDIISLQLKITQTHLNYKLIFHTLTKFTSELLYEDDYLTVHSLPLNHRIYTNGFLFKEKPGLRKLNMEIIEKIPEIDTCDYYNIKKGKDFTLKNGDIIKNEDINLPPPPTKSYAYCSDTRYSESLIPLIHNVDVLYHESTFQNDHKDLAEKTGHSTAAQAAEIAKKANVKKLILGHFSSRYIDTKGFLKEAQNVFPHVEIAREGKDIFSW